ncbi:AlpA family transcriptional regulator [Chromobacterium sp. IIBBL 290-4]|uniref:helix-turn-helix transcriptional regulator n=1 Tax=Chromobacterium sp. IIBBL 290-4 TaxID=2953890 RepID=UPI0020B84FE0|nr:AlpA family phage regulatory protein [Chromobacterium sp. IIBBL 290-4]UTH72512.1 AlpA family phage regulatory protein [Chromobacterium sp. IIBBL 290-4]
MAEQIKQALIRRKQLEQRLNVSRQWIYDRLNPKSPRYDPTFPKQIQLGARAGAVGWLEHEIDAWLESRIAASREAA